MILMILRMKQQVEIFNRNCFKWMMRRLLAFRIKSQILKIKLTVRCVDRLFYIFLG